MWPITLSGRLPIVAMVSHYLTIKLMGRGLIQKRYPKAALTDSSYEKSATFGINSGFPELSPASGQITHVLLTRLRLEYFPKEAFPFHLHV